MGGREKTEASALRTMMEMTRSQDHTFTGLRGDTIVTVRVHDIYTAVLEGIRLAAGSPDSVEQADLEGVDIVAIAQNTCCEIERIEGIFPNIPRRD